jgi:hypothetical protein
MILRDSSRWFDTRFAHRVSYAMHVQVRHLRAVLLYDDAGVWVARASFPYPPGLNRVGFVFLV